MFILSTNYPRLIDPVLLNRIDISNQIEFPSPGVEQIKQMLANYMKEHVQDNKFGIEPGVYDHLGDFAQDLNGFVGRQIHSLLGQSVHSLVRQKRLIYAPLVLRG